MRASTWYNHWGQVKSAIPKGLLKPLHYRPGVKKRNVIRREEVPALLEALIATAIVGSTSVATVMGQYANSTPSEAVSDVSIARDQMESIYKADYISHPATYPSISVPDSYTVTAETEAVEGAYPNTKRILVTIAKAGHVELVIETYTTRL